MLYAIHAEEVFLKYLQHCIGVRIGSSKFLYLYNYSNNQQHQQFSSSIADLFHQDQIH